VKFVLPRPEGGNEHGVVFYRHHGCASAKMMRSALEEPDVDMLQFSVGLVGYEMPMGVPFIVTSSNPCMVCGAQPSAWFEWQTKLIVP
jgi:hypothetical protein